MPKIEIKEDGSFMANGNRYVRHEELSIDYLEWYQYYMYHYKNSASFDTFMDKHAEICAKLNDDNKIHDFVTAQFNLREGIIKANDVGNNKPELYLATMVYVREGIKPNIWDKNVANEFISDWKVEGFDGLDFLFKASSDLKKPLADSEISLQNTLTVEAIAEKKKKAES